MQSGGDIRLVPAPDKLGQADSCTASPKLPQEPAADMPPQALPAAFSSRPWPPSLFLGLLCGGNEGIILRQLTFAANLATINKVSVREWRNGRRAGFRHQFQRSEGSTPFSRIKNGPKLRLGVIFYLAEKRGRTARPPAGGKQSARCNGDDRSQRLKQGGAVGAAF